MEFYIILTRKLNSGVLHVRLTLPQIEKYQCTDKLSEAVFESGSIENVNGLWFHTISSI